MLERQLTCTLKSIKCKQGTLHWTSYIALPSIEIESNAVLDWFAYYSCIQKINLIDSIIKCDVSLRQVLDRCIVAYTVHQCSIGTDC